tara:strand:+ start:1363 stop:1710 length:348 start_codon:yes stop_codon:yes gene_type:complete
LSVEDLGVAQRSFPGKFEELAVWHGSPEKVGEAGGEFEVVEGPFRLAGLIVLDAEEEIGMEEQGRERDLHGLLEAPALGDGLGDRGEEGSEVFFGEWSAVGEGSVVGEDLASGFR